MISRKAWMQIGRGDVVIFPSGPRSVQMGPRDMAETTQQDFVMFPRRNPSWYSRGNGTTNSTVSYHWTDCKEKCYLLTEVPASMVRDLLKMEAHRLKELGIDWRKAIKYETERAIRRVEQGLYAYSKCHARRAEGKANLA